MPFNNSSFVKNFDLYYKFSICSVLSYAFFNLGVSFLKFDEMSPIYLSQQCLINYLIE